MKKHKLNQTNSSGRKLMEWKRKEREVKGKKGEGRKEKERKRKEMRGNDSHTLKEMHEQTWRHKTKRHTKWVGGLVDAYILNSHDAIVFEEHPYGAK